jgi:phospholipase/lecithinase/hemolysin
MQLIKSQDRRAARVMTAQLLVLFAVTAALSGLTGCNYLTFGLAGGGGGKASAPSFATTVFIGDSLSAGFQNGSLLDTQQPNGFASLLAKQGSFTLTLPLIAPPGAPAVLELVSAGPPPVVQQKSGVTTGRDNPTEQPTDLAVPGHKLADLINAAPTATPTNDEDIITDLVLGFPLGNSKSQMDEAIQLDPTVLFVWTGNNDALIGVSSGDPSTMTPVATFTQDMQQLMTTLHTQTKATLIVANIPDVTTLPYLTPAAQLIAQAASETGQSQNQIALELGIQAGDLVNATGVSEAQSAIFAIQHGQTPAPLTGAGFLDATEITTVQSTVSQYNSAIAKQVTSVGGILVDVHALIQGLVKNGTTINGYHATTAFLGGLFSLDGVHPTNTGYALIANQFIDAINAKYKTKFVDVDVTAIAAADPLFGPNIKPTGSVVTIPSVAARSADRIIGAPK